MYFSYGYKGKTMFNWRPRPPFTERPGYLCDGCTSSLSDRNAPTLT